MKRCIIIPILFIFLFFGQSVRMVHSDTLDYRNLETLAVSLVIDQSGSMSLYDPGKLRETAAEIFVDLLSPDDYLGIVAFDDEVEEVLPMTKIDSVANRTRIKSQLPGRFDARGDTDYLLAFQKAEEQLQNHAPEGDVRRIIIFVTDGIPDPEPERRDEAGFMEEYMDALWERVDGIGRQDIPIFPIGFGDIDPSLLMEIAERTGGRAEVLNSPEGLANELFSILVDLKQRNEYLDGTYNVVGTETIRFPVDTFSAQSTLLFTYAEEMDVTLLAPEGVPMDDQVQLTRGNRYTIITIHQTEGEKTGEWQVELEGNGEVAMVSSFDLSVKLWVESPAPGVIHPVTEPLRIATYLSGNLPDGAEVEAYITKNGTLDPTPFALEEDNGQYTGTYGATETPGTYGVEVQVRVGNSVITTANRSVEVRNIPFIHTDFFLPEEGLLLGSTRLITASLRLGSTNLTPATGIQVERFQVFQIYRDGSEVSYPLRDDGSEDSGDIRRGDGMYSAILRMDELMEVRFVVRAQGTYRGEAFSIQRELGSSTIHTIGSAEVSLMENDVMLQEGQPIMLSIDVYNASHFSDVLVFEIPEEVGRIDNARVRLRPFERRTLTFRFHPAESPGKTILNIPITVLSESEDKAVFGSPMRFQVQFLSRWGIWRNRIAEYGDLIQMVFLALIILPMLYIFFGLVLYFLLVRPKKIVSGILRFGRKTNGGLPTNPAEVNLNDYHKEHVVVSFLQGEENGDILIEGTRYSFRLFIETVGDFSKYAFRDGYRAMKRTLPPIRTIVRVEEPGILVQEKNIFRQIDLIGTTAFESGEVFFVYEYQPSKRNKEGKNILEGKFERTTRNE